MRLTVFLSRFGTFLESTRTNSTQWIYLRKPVTCSKSLVYLSKVNVNLTMSVMLLHVVNTTVNSK